MAIFIVLPTVAVYLPCSCPVLFMISSVYSYFIVFFVVQNIPSGLQGYMSDINLLTRIAYELGLNFTEEAVESMLNLLENDVSPDNLAKIIDQCKNIMKSENAS